MLQKKVWKQADPILPGLADFQSFDGMRISSHDNAFDQVFAASVFHSPDSEQSGLLREWLRVLKPGGTAVIFDHNPLNPLPFMR